MGGVKHPQKSACGGRPPGKINASLNESLRTVKWGEFKISQLFKPMTIRRKIKGEDVAEKGIYPAYSSDSENNGIVGYYSTPEFICDSNNPVYIVFGDHTRTMSIARNSFSVLDNVKVLRPCIENTNALLFIFSVWKKQIPNLGYKRHWSIAKECCLRLPTKKGKIDIDFMESFIADLEAERVAELSAYLKLSGLDNYELSDCLGETHASLNEKMRNVRCGEYKLGALFDIETTLSFNTEKLVDGVEYDYVTRTSKNQGILQTTGFVNESNINASGTWSLGLLSMDFFYRRKPWYAGQFVRKIIPKVSIPERAVPFFSTILNKQKHILLSVLVRSVDETFKNISIKLPETTDGKINFEFIESFIAELEAERVAELSAYLKLSGFDNYKLSIEKNSER